MTPADRIAELEAKLATVQAECDRYYGHLAGLFWSGRIDNLTGDDMQKMADECKADRAKLARYESVTGLPEVPDLEPLATFPARVAVYNDANRYYAGALKAEFTEYKDTTNMQMAAISTAATSNSRNSAPALQRNHPYWSAPYNDVVTAVAREIRERERAVKADAETVSALCQLLADAVVLNGRILAERDAAKDALAAERKISADLANQQYAAR